MVIILRKVPYFKARKKVSGEMLTQVEQWSEGLENPVQSASRKDFLISDL